METCFQLLENHSFRLITFWHRCRRKPTKTFPYVGFRVRVRFIQMKPFPNQMETFLNQLEANIDQIILCVCTFYIQYFTIIHQVHIKGASRYSPWIGVDCLRIQRELRLFKWWSFLFIWDWVRRKSKSCPRILMKCVSETEKKQIHEREGKKGF